MRYLLIEGKMADKKAYIKYKNYMLLAMLKDTKGSGEQMENQQSGSSAGESEQEASQSEYS